MLQKLRGTNQKGFTLIELMIVIAIIGILSAIAIPNFLSYRTKGQDSAAKSDANNFYTASLAEFADTGVAQTFNSANLPAGFAQNADVTYTNGLVVDAQGGTTGTMTFSHSLSTTTYTLTGSTGAIL
jgi:prepilin-type N-terminal cleavage/methylation domain-containing protein